MSGFLARWSRRKAAAAAPAEAPSLPAVETLTGESDITAFLAAGVPAALQAQALRIAWQSDPRIAGFRGMADYDWDFNAEGYGRLALADDAAGLLRQALAPAAVAAAAAAPVQSRPPPAEAAPTCVAMEITPAPPPARRHGGAIPA